MKKNLQAIYLDQNGVNMIRALIEEKSEELQKLAKFSDSSQTIW